MVGEPVVHQTLPTEALVVQVEAVLEQLALEPEVLETRQIRHRHKETMVEMEPQGLLILLAVVAAAQPVLGEFHDLIA